MHLEQKQEEERKRKELEQQLAALKEQQSEPKDCFDN